MKWIDVKIAYFAAAALVFACLLLGGPPVTSPYVPPTTQAGSRPQLFMDGWTGAGGLIASTQPTTLPSNVPLIPAGTDLATINKQPVNTVWWLTPGVLYTSSAMIKPPTGFTLHQNGANISLTGSIAMASNFSIHNPYFEFDASGGGQILSGGVVFRNFDPTCYVHDVTIPNGVCATGYLNDMGAAGARLSHCTFGTMSSETVYITSGLLMDHCTLYRSMAQDTVRQSPATDVSLASGTIITDCIICPEGILNPIHNEALACRAGSMEVTRCLIGTWARAGQVNTPGVKIGANVPSIVFNYCTFSFPAGVLQGFNAIQVSQGVSATINNCTFIRDGNSVPISVVNDGTSNCFINNCTVYRTVARMKTKTYTFAPDTSPANPLVSEQGTITLDPPFVAATQPTTQP